MMARMKVLEDIRRKFSNRREWRDFISAVQCSVNYSTCLQPLRVRVHVAMCLAQEACQRQARGDG